MMSLSQAPGQDKGNPWGNGHQCSHIFLEGGASGEFFSTRGWSAKQQNKK